MATSLNVETSDPSSISLHGEALSLFVHQTALVLQTTLNEAEKTSSGWTNQPLGDALVDVAVTKCLAALETTGCVGPANRLPSSRLWNLLGEQLQHSWLVNRARTKPRGYAGDFELLNWICEDRVCDHPFGRTVDRFFQNQAAPHAVRARTSLIAGAMAQRLLSSPEPTFTIASVGSNSAADVHRGLQTLSVEQHARCQVVLLDLDPAAIEFGCKRLAPYLPHEHVAGRQVNLKRLNRLAEVLPDTDFLTCPGLFDYLNDEDAAKVLSLFWSRLKSGGAMMVGNFAPWHPTRSYMEWFGNWYLIYRTRDQLRNLALSAGIPEYAFAVSAERFGIDLFLTAYKI